MWMPSHISQPRNPLAWNRPKRDDRPASGDVRGRAEVAVAERFLLGRSAARPGAGSAGRHRTRSASPISATPGRCCRLIMSPTTEISGWPGSVRSGWTLIRPARSCSAPVFFASRSARAGAAMPAVHSTVAASYRLIVPSGPLASRPRASTWVTIEPMCSSTPIPVNAFVALAESLGPNGASGTLPPSKSSTVASSGCDAPELVPQGERRELVDLPGQLDPGRPRPDESERQPTAALLRVGRGLCHLERPEDPPADRQGVRQRLHPGSELGELVVTEVGLLHAGRDDEVVVRDLDRGARRPQPDHPPPSTSTSVTSARTQSTFS